MNWILDNAETLFQYHLDRRPFLAIHPSHGVVRSAGDEEEFQAVLNDMRPSVRKQLYLTCTNLWVHGADA